MDDEDALWRPLARGFAWPTVALAVAVVGLEVFAWIGTLSGVLSLGAGFLVATLAAYLAFTVMHEASHGNVHGDQRRLAWAGTLLGWLAGLPLFAPFPAFQVLHLRHHSYTNDPQKDPDYFVAGRLRWALLKCVGTLPAYYTEFLLGPSSRSRAGRRHRTTVLAGLLALIATALVLSLFGLGAEVMALWLGPAAASTTILSFLFDWLPHRPHTQQGRYRDTRALDHAALDVLFLAQNLHLIHHLYPRVPWFRYRAVLEEGRDAIAQQGGRIVRLRQPI